MLSNELTFVFTAGCVISGIFLIAVWEGLRSSWSSGRIKGALSKKLEETVMG